MIHGINAPKFFRNNSESVSLVILPCNIKPYIWWDLWPNSGIVIKFLKAHSQLLSLLLLATFDAIFALAFAQQPPAISASYRLDFYQTS